jgi:hypothetical protein
MDAQVKHNSLILITHILCIASEWQRSSRVRQVSCECQGSSPMVDMDVALSEGKMEGTARITWMLVEVDLSIERPHSIHRGDVVDMTSIKLYSIVYMSA